LTESCFDLLPQIEQVEGGVPRLTGILRALVAERVPIGELRDICKRYLEVRGGLSQTDMVEQLRSLPQIAPRLPGSAAGTQLISMGADFERRILAAVHRDGSHAVLAMLPDFCQATLGEVRERLTDQRHAALLVESAPARPFVRKLIEMEWPNVPVLSRHELEVMSPMEGVPSRDLAAGGGETRSGAS
jgi:type III secretory pathway component EscV